MDFELRTAIHVARHVVTAIHVGNLAGSDKHLGRVVFQEFIFSIDGLFCNIDACSLLVFGVYICHSASTIHVVDGHFWLLQGEQYAVLIGHVALVATAVEVVDGSLHHVPCGSDVHLGEVVATEHAYELVFVGEGGEVDAHGIQTCIVDNCTSRHTCSSYRVVIVDTDIGIFHNRCIVATTVGIAVGTACKFDIYFIDCWQ